MKQEARDYFLSYLLSNSLVPTDLKLDKTKQPNNKPAYTVFAELGQSFVSGVVFQTKDNKWLFNTKIVASQMNAQELQSEIERNSELKRKTTLWFQKREKRNHTESEKKSIDIEIKKSRKLK